MEGCISISLQVLKLLLSLLFIYSAKTQLYTYKSYGISDGLPHERITSFTIDQRGYLWVGTYVGLCFFDGNKFILLKETQFKYRSISDSFISALYTDSENRIWVGTANAGFRIIDSERQSINYYHDEDDFHLSRILGFAEGENKIWILHNSVLSSFDKTEAKFKQEITDTTLSGFKSIHLDSKQFLIGSTDKYYVKSFSGNTTNSSKISTPYGDIRSILSDKDTLWLGSHQGLIQIVNNKMFKRYTHSANGISLSNIRTISKTSDNKIWIGAINGLFVKSKSEIERPNIIGFTENDWTDDVYGANIYDIMEDRQSNIWVAKATGLIKISKMSEISLHKSPTMIREVYRDSQGLLWIGHNKHKVEVIDQKGKKIKFSELKGLLEIEAITEDRNGKIYLAPWRAGIWQFDKTRKTVKKIPVNLDNEIVHAINTDPLTGMIWIATDKQGLIRYNPESDSYKKFSPVQGDSTSLSASSVRVIYFSRAKDLWVGTTGGGVSRFDRNTEHFIKIESTDTSHSLNKDIVYSMVEDSKGNIWVGARAGLHKIIDGKSVLQLTSNNGLSNSSIMGILEGADKFLYVSTLNGINKIDPQTLDVSIFKRSNGLPIAEFSSQATFQDKDSTMFFAGVQGFLQFKSLNKASSNTKYQTYITRIIPHESGDELSGILNERIIHLNEINSSLTIQFSKSDYNNQENPVWYYRVIPENDKWLTLVGANEITYGSFSGGEHQFEITAKIPRTPEDEHSVARLTIQVEPVFWKTFWFRSIVIVLIISIALIPFIIREMKRNELEKLRKKIASDLHDEVGSQITRVSIYTDLISQYISKPEKLKELQGKISIFSKMAIQSMSDAIWFLDSSEDDLRSLSTRMIEHAQSMLPEENFDLHFRSENLENVHIDSIIKQNLLLIFKEVITNIAKHSQANEVDIQFNFIDSQFSIRIKDNGVGLPDALRSSGNGLNNIKRRAKMINADCFFVSDSGLQFDIMSPLKHKSRLLSPN